MKILLIIEDKISAKLLKSIIQTEFSQDEVHWVDNFSSAKNLLTAENYNLLIVDNLLSGRASLEVVNELRKEMELFVPVIMVTDTSLDSFKKKAYQAGVTSFLLQPFSKEEVIEEIRKNIIP